MIQHIKTLIDFAFANNEMTASASATAAAVIAIELKLFDQ